MYLPEIEKRTFDCPRCHKPIISRKGECIFCHYKFDDKTVFACPRCGALVASTDEKCHGCETPLSDSGLAVGTMTDKETDEVLAELEGLSKEIAKKLESGMEGMSADEKELIERQIQKMLELQIAGAGELGIRETLAPLEKKAEARKPVTKLQANAKVGRINGLKMPPRKEPIPRKLEKPPLRRSERRQIFDAWMQRRLPGRILGWQLLAIVIVAALVLSSLLAAVYLSRGPGEIVIDGEYSDWDEIPSYSFSALLPELDLEISEAKITRSDDSLLLYIRGDGSLFSDSDPSSLYIFVDTDADPITGYDVSTDFGADTLLTLVGWNGLVRTSGMSEFSDISDHGNWSMWTAGGAFRIAQEDNEIELSIFSGSGIHLESPLVRLISVINGLERCTPTMGLLGTMVAVQRPLVDDEIIGIHDWAMVNVSLIAMGIQDGHYAIEPILIDESDQEIPINPLTVTSDDWISLDLSADMSSRQDGDAFSYSFSIPSDDFPGAVQIMGEPARGYYLSIPDQIEIDGIFGDWTGRKSADSDDAPLENQNIDIREYGAATQGDDHLFYVGVAGTALGGANIPEQRVRYVPESPPTPVVRLKRTGEDLLQAYIDRNPEDGTGKMIQAGESSIYADILVEIYGRNGIAKSTYVREWSIDDSAWQYIGGVDDVAALASGVEFSVDKSLLGNLTGSELIFFTTDWKRHSDHSFLGAVLADPWVILEGGEDYRSADGIDWALGGSISLEPGDRVVDLTVSPTRDYVFAVTNTGRVYRWIVGTSMAWGSELTNPIQDTTDVVAIAMLNNGDGFVITSDGRLFSAEDIIPVPPLEDWNSVSQIIGYTDFVDLIWRSGSALSTAELYALRNTKDTALNLTTDGGSSWGLAGVSTGSTQKHTQMVVMPGTSYDLYVLCEDSDMRYSSDSGSNWGSIGDLPAPGVGNQSVYMGITIDAQSNIWVITNTGYCYKSEDSGVSFAYTGRPATLEITGITAPIPEFPMISLAILGSISIMMLFRMKALRKWKNEKKLGDKK